MIDVATVCLWQISSNYHRPFILISAIACKESPSQDESSGSPSLPEPSSVFLVTIDTLRSDRLGVYGNDVIKTPHLDRLANRGTVLEAFAQSSTTTPSHASLSLGSTHVTIMLIQTLSPLMEVCPALQLTFLKLVTIPLRS